jgi:uncharacterized protein
LDRAIRCQLITWRQVRNLSRALAFRVREDGFRPDVIIAIGRGGWVPGRLLSDYLGNLNLTDIKIEHYQGTRKGAAARVRYPLRAEVEGRRLLVVDDVTDSGDSLAAALAHIRTRGAPTEIRTAVLHHKTVSAAVPDYFARRVVSWRWLIYPWAVVEDLSGLIRELGAGPGDPALIAERLRLAHGIRVSAATVQDVLTLSAYPEV